MRLPSPTIQRMGTTALFVPGIPRPQGSKRGIVIGKRAVLIEQSKHVKGWRGDIKALASERFNGAPTRGPVKIGLKFYMPRPKAHYRTGKHAHELKPTAPVFHTSTPDVDKLIRAVLDGLTGVAYLDDSQVCVFGETGKWYGDSPGVEISLDNLQDAGIG